MSRLIRYFNWTKYFIVSLRFNILSIFITLFLSAVLLIVTINYFNAAKALSYMAHQLMRSVSNALYKEFTREIENIIRDNTLSVDLISKNILNQQNQAEMLQYVFNLSRQFQIVQGAYWGDEKGNFVVAEYTPNNTIMTAVVDQNSAVPTQKIIHRDEKDNILSQTLTKTVHYDPRKRPWYLLAKTQKKTSWTKIYPFLPRDYLGITISNPIYDKTGQLLGVFGMDIQLEWISSYISQQKLTKNSRIFIVTNSGKIIAYSNPYQISYLSRLTDIHSLKTPWVGKSFDLYKKNHQEQFTFHDQGKEYLATYQRIHKLSSEDWLIGIVAPRNDFIEEIKKVALITSSISLAVLIFGIFLMSKLVTLIVQPLKQLVQETQRVKKFDLKGNPNIQSRIKEILFLSEAFNGMKQGLKSFCYYIPMALVRQLIESGLEARIGGTKKELVVFFSDIQGFTTLSHQMDVNALMRQLCQYFDELTHIITKEKGTIDKYIGDSIMAFWGAPQPVKSPCHHAANAALACIERLSQLNEKWIKEGKPPLYTRIGIHMGEAIVGNLGSSERLNYTAVGDTINIANRLEGINKKYGTWITVSQVVYEKLKDDFDLRFLGHTKLKGLSAREKIYELVSKKEK